MRQARFLSMIILAVWLVPVPSFAGTFKVSPIRVTLSPNGTAAVVNLTNPGTAKTLVKLQHFAWVDASDPQALDPTQDLLVVPPIFELQPDQTQTIRLAWRGASEINQERIYRLVIEEVPPEVGGQNGVTMALQLSLPIFVTPDGAVAEPVWSLERTAEKTRLVLANQGDAHVRLKSIDLLGTGEVTSIFSTNDVDYVLAGKEHSWPVDLSATQLDGPLTLKAETNLGPLETTVSWPEG